MPQHVNPETFGFLVTDLCRLIRAEMDRAIVASGIGVTPGEARALAHASRAGPVRQNVLAERMGVEAMTLSSYLDRLEARALVRRVADPGDRRAKRVELTDDAGAVLQEVARIGALVRKKAAGSMRPDDWSVLQEQLKTVRDNLAEAALEAAARRSESP